jgi:hypothetical protein
VTEKVGADSAKDREGRPLPQLKDIDFGQPDANAEQQIAARTKSVPAFVKSFVQPPLLGLEGFLNGTKYFLNGQKGTGKTAVFRYVDQKLKEKGIATGYIIFRDEILEERDLTSLDWQIVFDDSRIRATKHYLHSMKRLLASVILSHANEAISDISEEDGEFLRPFLDRLKRTKAAQVFSLAIGSIDAVLSQTQLDASKVAGGVATANVSRILKRQNDALISYTCRVLKKLNRPLRVFIDELHFAYRDKETMKQDAMLVRDTLIAIANLNDRFQEEEVDCVLYAAFRSEFWEHPIISAAEINNTLLSFGESLSWTTFQYDLNHPVLEIASQRIAQAINRRFTARDLFSTYLANIDAEELLNQTWGKPRDMIRFMNEAKKMYPRRVTLSMDEYRSVVRSYSKESWREIETALSAFFDVGAMEGFRALLRKYGPKVFSQKISMRDFLNSLRDFYSASKLSPDTGISFDSLVQILYVLGVFGTKTIDARGQEIFYRFHRGNAHPDLDGELILHPAIARAFS